MKIENVKEWLANPANLKQEQERIEDVRRHALLDYPFLGDKALRSQVTLNLAAATARTDGRKIEFGPLFAASLSFPHLLFVFLHELLHISLGHHVRRGDRDPVLWNQACDYVVNSILFAAGLELPEGALFDPRFDDLSEEQICSILEKEQEKEGEPGGKPGGKPSEEGDEEGTGEGQTDEDPGDEGAGPPGQPGEKVYKEGPGDGDPEPDPSNDGEGGYEVPDASEWGEVEDLTAEDGSELNEKEKSNELVKQALENESAKRLGNAIGDGNSKAFSEGLGDAWEKSKYDWEAELEEFITQCIAGERESSWSRPNRRFIGSGDYLPGFVREGIGRIAVLSDCSASVGNAEFDLGLAQCEKIINDLPQEPEAVVWIQFDDDVKSVDIFESGATFDDPKRSGYGGTLIAPPFKWLEDSGEQYDCIIILTDCGIFDLDEVNVPDCPVIWADTYGASWAKFPFGKHVRICK